MLPGLRYCFVVQQTVLRDTAINLLVIHHLALYVTTAKVACIYLPDQVTAFLTMAGTNTAFTRIDPQARHRGFPPPVMSSSLAS